MSKKKGVPVSPSEAKRQEWFKKQQLLKMKELQDKVDLRKRIEKLVGPSETIREKSKYCQ